MSDMRVLGVFTDGDLRRALDRAADLRTTRMDQVMSRHAKTVRPTTLAAEAVHLMETHRITSLIVVDADRQDRRRAQRARPAARRCGLKARKATPLARIELLILDVDGVLTDGRLYFAARGEALKVFHVRDGHGIKLLMAAGVAVAAFSGRRSRAVAARMSELRVPPRGPRMQRQGRGAAPADARVWRSIP